MSDEKPPKSAQGSGSVRKTRRDGMPMGRPFTKGTIANPGGMSAAHRKLLEAFRDKARRYSAQAMQMLVEVVEGQHGAEPKDRVKAAEIILDRAWGKAAQPIVGDAEAPPVGIQAMTSADRRLALAEALGVARQALPASSDGDT